MHRGVEGVAEVLLRVDNMTAVKRGVYDSSRELCGLGWRETRTAAML